MTPFEFTPYLTAGIWLYIIILFLFSFIYIPVFFKLSFSVFDPFFLILIGSYFSSVLVVYLYLIDLIDYKYFIYYVFSEILFFLGMLLFSHRKSTVFYNRGILNKDKLDNLSIVKSMILVSSFLYFLSTSLDYYINGIPVFRITYIGAFVGSGGLGIIERFNDVSLNVLTLSLFTILLSKRNFINKKFWVNISIVILLFIILTFFLSGSKSKILILGAAWVYVVVFLVFGRFYNKLKKILIVFNGFFFIFFFSLI